jgi:threonine/homoserine/homoserine lactone efflux protein
VELLVAMGIAAFVLIGIGGVVYLLFIAPSIGNADQDKGGDAHGHQQLHQRKASL